MGIGKSKSNLLKSHELDEFAKVTAFSLDQINNLYTHFKAISALEKDDGVIDYDEFCAALETEKSLITKRLFQIFDENHDTVLNFREFIVGISILNEENVDMQIKLTFKLFDPEATGIIKADYVKEILLSSLNILETMVIPSNVVEEIVNRTFEELNKDAEKEDKTTIDFTQYRKMVRNDPSILKWLYLNLDRVQQSAKLLLKNPKKFSKTNNSTPVK